MAKAAGLCDACRRIKSPSFHSTDDQEILSAKVLVSGDQDTLTSTDHDSHVSTSDHTALASTNQKTLGHSDQDDLIVDDHEASALDDQKAHALNIHGIILCCTFHNFFLAEGNPYLPACGCCKDTGLISASPSAAPC